MRVSPRNPTCEPLAQSVERLPFKVRWGGDGEQRALHSVAEVSVLPALSVAGDGVLVTPGNRPCQRVSVQRLYSRLGPSAAGAR